MVPAGCGLDEGTMKQDMDFHAAVEMKYHKLGSWLAFDLWPNAGADD
jgi:hypothetical protein